MSKHTGWTPVYAANLPVTIDNQHIYYHKGRDCYAIERDHSHLGGLSKNEREILDSILAAELMPDYRERPSGPGVSDVLGEVG